MEEERSPTSVHSSSFDGSDAETALSFNISQISTAQTFDYDELMDLMGGTRTRKEKRNPESANGVIEEVTKQFEELDNLNDDFSSQKGRALGYASALLAALHGDSLLSERTVQQYTEIRQVSDALLPEATTTLPSSSDSSISSLEYSLSETTSSDRETFAPCYSSPAISYSAAATPDQTVLSYESNNDVQRSSITSAISQESLSEEGYEMEHAGILVSAANKKHGVKLDLCIGMSITAPGGPLVVSTVTVPE